MYDDYTIINMEPTIIPTYFPAVRLWNYDISGKKGDRWRQTVDDLDKIDGEEEVEGVIGDETNSKRKGNHDHHPSHRHTSPHSPSRTRSYLTPLGYVQYYLPLFNANANSGYGPGPHGAALLAKRGEKGHRPPATWEIEYTTYTAKGLARSLLGLAGQPSAIPLRLLSVEVYQAVRNHGVKGGVDALAKILQTKENLISYELEDLTIPSWLKLGRELGRSEQRWKLYLKRMFVSTGIERSW